MIQQPGESREDYLRREEAHFQAWKAEVAAARAELRAKYGCHGDSGIALSPSTGNYDCNGNPKGSGWW